LRRHPRPILALSFAACVLFDLGRSSCLGQFGPLPPIPQPQNVVPLSPAEQLGKDLFFDSTLSNPPGYACATCHSPATGFTGPNSSVNQVLGTTPGITPGRFGMRKPQAIPYSTFAPRGPLFDADVQVWLGGNFWDGRAAGNAEQARMPFLDPNEMNNTATGPYPPHYGGFASLVAQKIRTRPYAALFQQVLGAGSLASPDAVVYAEACEAIAVYEASAEVNRFSSKYDNSMFAVPPRNGYTLSASEANGMVLFFGQAQCFQCHSSATLGMVQATTGGKDVFTMYCYANIGTPKNPTNPFYFQTNTATNPIGANRSGLSFIDYGLAENPNPAADGTMFSNQVPGDIPQFRGLFKAPSLRNVDKRPSPAFVKAYTHTTGFSRASRTWSTFTTRGTSRSTSTAMRSPSTSGWVLPPVTPLSSRRRRSSTTSRTPRGSRPPTRETTSPTTARWATSG
jgi:cytochrome c peroxidase